MVTINNGKRPSERNFQTASMLAEQVIGVGVQKALKNIQDKQQYGRLIER